MVVRYAPLRAHPGRERVRSPVYEQLAAAGRGVLATGRDKAGSARLAYYGAKFDGHIFPFRHGLSGPLSIFASRAGSSFWRVPPASTRPPM